MKYHQDIVHSNKHFSVLGGVSNTELNALEFEFISTIGFESLLVSEENFELMRSNVRMYHEALKNKADTEP